MAGKTLYDKVWEAHLVKERDNGTALVYIDRHLIHEVTSPQAFEGLRLAGRSPWRAGANLATPDHNVPTTIDERSRGLAGIQDQVSKLQVKTLDENCREFNILAAEVDSSSKCCTSCSFARAILLSTLDTFLRQHCLVKYNFPAQGPGSGSSSDSLCVGDQRNLE